MTSLVYFFVASFLFCGAYGVSYKIKPTSMAQCKVADNRWDPTVNVSQSFGIRKLNRDTYSIWANFTIENKVGPLFITLRAYQVRPTGTKDLIFKLEKQSCKSPITYQLIDAIHIKLDKECFILPGQYDFTINNIEDYDWFLSRTVSSPGKYAYEVEFGTPRGITTCSYLTCEVVPKKDTRSKQ